MWSECRLVLLDLKFSLDTHECCSCSFMIFKLWDFCEGFYGFNFTLKASSNYKAAFSWKPTLLKCLPKTFQQINKGWHGKWSSWSIEWSFQLLLALHVISHLSLQRQNKACLLWIFRAPQLCSCIATTWKRKEIELTRASWASNQPAATPTIPLVMYVELGKHWNHLMGCYVLCKEFGENVANLKNKMELYWS